jgi:peptidoglycan/xylan/chitin deacetylase (PgdA/CDA1 family)
MNLKILLWMGLTTLCFKQKDIAPDVRENSKTIVCFVYHRFGDKRYPSTNIPLSDFESHLKYLKESQFQVLTLSDAIAYLNSDEPVRKTAVLTIDDGYKSFYDNGLKLLERYKMPATLFINTKTVGASDFMDWNQLKKVADAGIEIGNHTHSHDYFLSRPSDKRYSLFRDEINRSQSIIREHLEITPKVFTYPYGEFDTRMKAIVKEAGFICASAQNSGVLYEDTDRFQIPRFPMSETYSSLKQFIEKSSMLPFKIVSSIPSDTSVPTGDSRPSLVLRIKSDDLVKAKLKCFVQGGACRLEIAEEKAGEITVKLQATKSIVNRRRTLYTITCPDKNGAWHWYSHLWINPEIN